MNKTEKEIRNAFENATPDVLETVLLHDCPEKGIVIPRAKRKFVPFVLRRILSALISLLLILGLVALAMLVWNS